MHCLEPADFLCKVPLDYFCCEASIPINYCKSQSKVFRVGWSSGTITVMIRKKTPLKYPGRGVSCCVDQLNDSNYVSWKSSQRGEEMEAGSSDSLQSRLVCRRHSTAVHRTHAVQTRLTHYLYHFFPNLGHKKDRCFYPKRLTTEELQKLQSNSCSVDVPSQCS